MAAVGRDVRPLLLVGIVSAWDSSRSQKLTCGGVKRADLYYEMWWVS
jgi:hypothetical protein